MTFNGFLQIAVYLIVLLLLVKPLGVYMARVYQGSHTLLDPVFGPLERGIYRLAGVHPEEEMDWKTYAVALLVFSALSLLLLYAWQRLQGFLPLNPQHLTAVAPDLAFNTAVSFASNTNWQNYAGETTMSYLTQMMGLTVQNFVSAAAGIAVLMAFIRALARKQTNQLGNFWVDLTRGVLYILLPLSIILALALVSQGVVQTLSSDQQVSLLQPFQYQQQASTSQDTTKQDMPARAASQTVSVKSQTLALGPVASQIAIKQLGTNGGGFFNTNSSHPFENPTPLSNFLEMLAILLIPASLTYTFGLMVGDTRQGWALLVTMTAVLVVAIIATYAAESAGNPRLAALGVDVRASATQPGGNMEGKEVRFGIPDSVLWATATTAASNGSVNSMHDSYMPLGGLVLMVLIQLGEVIFGGVGSGLYGMLVFVIVAVFVAGLMVGRTPEYLGKKIETFDVKMAALLILIAPFLVLVFTAIATITTPGQASIQNPGPHGFSEILYAFTSQGNNNGSAFAGLNGNTLFYNFTGGLAMLAGRFWLAIPTLALAGSLARKKKTPPSTGTLPTHTPLFIGWLIAIVVIVGALNFLPALSLGPIVEHLLLWK